MKISELIDKLEEIQHEHGDIYLSIRHSASCEFSQMDDLTDIRTTQYDKDVNLAVIYVVN